jgi:hypothetical protein
MVLLLGNEGAIPIPQPFASLELRELCFATDNDHSGTRVKNEYGNKPGHYCTVGGQCRQRHQACHEQYYGQFLRKTITQQSRIRCNNNSYRLEKLRILVPEGCDGFLKLESKRLRTGGLRICHGAKGRREAISGERHRTDQDTDPARGRTTQDAPSPGGYSSSRQRSPSSCASTALHLPESTPVSVACEWP